MNTVTRLKDIKLNVHLQVNAKNLVKDLLHSIENDILPIVIKFSIYIDTNVIYKYEMNEVFN